MKVHVLHENPDWYAPLGAAFDAAGVPHEQWLLGEGVLDLTGPPPDGVFWSRMSASSHTRGHPYAKELARGVLCWLEAHGRVVVNGRRVLELEVSKVDQLTALAAAGFDVPATIAVAGRDGLAAAARRDAGPVHHQAQPGRQGPGRAAVVQPRGARGAPGRAGLRGPGRRHHAGAGVPARGRAVHHPGRVRRRRVPLRAHRGHRARRVRAVPGGRVRGGAGQLGPALCFRAVAARCRTRPRRACSRCGTGSTTRSSAGTGTSPPRTGSASPGSSSSRPRTAAWSPTT